MPRHTDNDRKPAAPSWASEAWSPEDGESRTIFDFPVAYLMSAPLEGGGRRPVLFCEREQIGAAFTPGQVVKSNLDLIDGFIAPTVELCILAERRRWVYPKPKTGRAPAPTLKKIDDAQRSQSQLLCGLVEGAADPVLFTLSAKSTKAGDLLQGLTLASKLSTRAITSGLLKPGSARPPTYVHRLTLAFGPPIKRENTEFSWMAFPWLWSMAGADLASSGMSSEGLAFVRQMYRAIGQDWIASWRDPEPDEGSEGSGKGSEEPADDDALSRAGEREQAHRSRAL